LDGTEEVFGQKRVGVFSHEQVKILGMKKTSRAGIRLAKWGILHLVEGSERRQTKPSGTESPCSTYDATASSLVLLAT
jgi:hypothetical protein